MDGELNTLDNTVVDDQYYNIPAKYKVSIADRISIEQSQFDWPACVNEIHVFDFRHLQAMEGEDSDSIWDNLVRSHKRLRWHYIVSSLTSICYRLYSIKMLMSPFG
jgi:hypothetical protein